MKEQKVKITDPFGVLDQMPPEERREWVNDWKKYLRLPNLPNFNFSDGPAVWLASAVPGEEEGSSPALLVTLVSIKMRGQESAKPIATTVFKSRFDDDDGGPEGNPLLAYMIKAIIRQSAPAVLRD